MRKCLTLTLTLIGGDTVVHIGEWEGDTGTAAFEKARMFYLFQFG